MHTVKIIGCGLSGLTAGVILKEKGYFVKIYEQRDHIGGNCYDCNINGTLTHKYGPHIFHTNDQEVFDFLSKFTEWVSFENRPKGNTKLGLITLPYSKKTINELGRELSLEEITDVIFKDYSEKQWGVSFSCIPKTITNRVPRTADKENPTWYDGDAYQCLPKQGYTKMMERMIECADEVYLGVNNSVWKQDNTDLTIYTGKIDEYFDYCFGRLPYRTLEFQHTITKTKLEHAIINQNTKSVAHTREYDHSYFSANHKNPTTVITKEFSKKCQPTDIPYYPIPFGKGIATYNKYKKLTETEKNVMFLGRLATYTYLDMWMAVKQAMLKLKSL